MNNNISNDLLHIYEAIEDVVNRCNKIISEKNMGNVDNIYDVGKCIVNSIVNSKENGRLFIEQRVINSISSKITQIKQYMFASNTSLSSVNLPACKELNNYAFVNCTSLSSIDLPVCNIVCDRVFTNCTSLSSVNLPNCSYIGNYAFDNCTSLSSVTLGHSNVVSLLTTGTFNNTPMSNSTYTGSFGSIYVPASLVDAYKVASNWSAYADRITAIVE